MIEALAKLKDLGFTVLEARLMGLSKVRRKDGDWCELKFHIHPDDMPNELFKVALGTRLSAAMVELADDEQPVEKQPKPFKDLSPAQQAGILCKQANFQEWCQSQARQRGHLICRTDPPAEIAAGFVRVRCRVQSRAELNTKPSAFEEWKLLLAQFEEDTRLPDRR